MTDEVLVRAEHICKYFKIGGGRMLHAVEDVNLDIHRGEPLGLVGESGCGKSTLGRTLMGIYQPTKGKLIYDGKPVDLSNKKDRFAFAKKAQIVFQDPYASLDPRMTVGSIIEEGMGSPASMPTASRTSFPAASASASALPARSPSSRSSSSATSRFPRWMCRFRHRSSTCCTICRSGWG